MQDPQNFDIWGSQDPRAEYIYCDIECTSFVLKKDGEKEGPAQGAPWTIIAYGTIMTTMIFFNLSRADILIRRIQIDNQPF